jgi:hypothetical protein
LPQSRRKLMKLREPTTRTFIRDRLKLLLNGSIKDWKNRKRLLLEHLQNGLNKSLDLTLKLRDQRSSELSI